MALCENALHFALKILKPGGHFVAKIFRGGAEVDLMNIVKQHFKTKWDGTDLRAIINSYMASQP